MNKKLKKLFIWAGISGAIALETSVLSRMLERKSVQKSAQSYLLHEYRYESKPVTFNFNPVVREAEEENSVSPIEAFVKGRKVIPLGPVYGNMPAAYCSRYVRFAAKDMFGLQYPECDAWLIRNYSHVGKIRLNESVNLENLADEEKLRPGMIVGMFYPKSNYKNRSGAKIAGYTHLMLYTGEENGNLFAADHFGKETRPKVAIKDAIKRNNLTPIEVLYLK